MNKNLSEKAAHRKRLSFKELTSKNIFLCTLLCLVAGNRFFQRTVFLYFTKVVATIYFSVDAVFLEQHLRQWIAYILCIWSWNFEIYLKGIELIRNSSCSHLFDEWHFFYNKRTIAATDSFKFTVFLRVVAMRYHSY